LFLYSVSISVSIRWKPGRSQFVPEQPSSTKNTGFGKWFFLAYSRRIAFWERDLSRINSPKQHWLST